MSNHVDREIDAHLREARIIGRQVIVYTIERYSKDKKYRAEFEGKLTIKEVKERK